LRQKFARVSQQVGRAMLTPTGQMSPISPT
jgi:hypothetical protein